MSDSARDDHQIIAHISQMYCLDITTKTLKELDKSVVQQIYVAFLGDFDANIDALNQIPIDAPAAVAACPNGYKNVAFAFGIVKALHFIFSHLLHDVQFCFGDYIDPRPGRTRKFFVAIVNFFYESRETWEKMNSIKQEVADLKVQKEKSLENLQKNKDLLKELRKKAAQQEIAAEQLKERLSEVSGEIEALNENKNALKAENDLLKQQKSEIEAALNDKEIKILESREAKEKLEAQIVTEEDLNLVHEWEDKINSVKEEYYALSEKSKVLQADLQLANSVKEKIKKYANNVEESMEEFREESTLKAKLEDCKKELKLISDEDEAVCFEMSKLMQEEVSLRDDFSLYSASSQEKEKQLEEEIVQKERILKELHETYKDLLSMDNEEVAALEQKINKSKQSIDKFKQSLGTSIATVINKYKERRTLREEESETIHRMQFP